MRFPGIALARGSDAAEFVRPLQTRLNALGCGPIEESGVFDEATEAAVRHFQSVFPTPDGREMRPDGQVGPQTWAALFGPEEATAPPPALTPAAAGGGLGAEALLVAASQIGVSEDPPGSNRGARVEAYQRSAGCPPGSPWCAAFVNWCVEQAAQRRGCPNPLPRTGSVLELWRLAQQAGLRCVPAERAMAEPRLITPGAVFVMNHGEGKGHTGFVEGLRNGLLVTIEGNTAETLSREGTGVFRLDRRSIGSINTGFVLLDA